MTRERLERVLREVEVPGEPGARERVRRTVAAAHRERAPRRHRRAVIAWAAILAAASGLVLAHGPARAYEQIRAVVHQRQPARPQPQSGLALPTGGRLLVTDGNALWLVQRNGRRTRLGAWRDATWSPRGLFAGVSAGHTLAAIEPAGGAIRWRLARDEPVSLPRWAPDGRHIAYRSGHTLRIVYGNGLHDVRAGERMAAVAPAWRPGDAHTVAWAATDGTVTVEDGDTAKVLWRRRGGPVAQLAWSRDGRRLLIAGRRRGALYDIVTGHREPLALAPGERLEAAAFGSRLALAVLARGQSEVRVGGEPVLTAPGRVRDLAWSPDGRWLLAGWAGADHWLLARGSAQARESAVSAVRQRFGAGERLRDWCC